MFRPEDPLTPPEPHFDEAWQAQALAMADAMVQAGHFAASEWAAALGMHLAVAQAQGAPDTLQTYYLAVLAALEDLSETRAGISRAEQADRRAAWEEAYHRTPHGKPVEL